MKDQVKRNGQNGQRSQRLCEAVPAHFARQFAREPYQRRTRERGKQPQPQQRVPEEMAGNPGDQNCAGRMVHIAPRHVFRAGEVIHFIAKDAVTRGRQQVQQKLG